MPNLHCNISCTLNQQEFISKLTQLMLLERIYLSHYQYGKTRYKELTILLPASGTLQISAAKALIAMVMADYPEYRFKIFYVQEVRWALKAGSLVFYTTCREENLLYQSEWAGALVVADVSAKVVLKQARRNFQKDWKKVTNFRDGFHFYFGQANYPFAAFMLHQVIELSYHIAEVLLIGREKASHAIRSHQKLMQAYDPELAEIFKEDEEGDMIMLSLLDDAYLSVRYEQDYVIEKDQLLCILAKADRMEKRIKELYELVVEEFKRDLL